MSFFRNIISGGAAIDPNKIREMEGKLAAIEKSQASIEFKPDGTIVTANQNFLDVMGYRLEEIQGQHHSIFVSPQYSKTPEYAALAFCSVISDANFTTFITSPSSLTIGLYVAWIQTELPSLATRSNSSALNSPRPNFFQNRSEKAA